MTLYNKLKKSFPLASAAVYPRPAEAAAGGYVRETLVPMRDACYRKIRAQYKAWPSARASQALAKCRKARGAVRKSPAGTALKRWQKEKWVNVKTGRPCGNATDKNEYCRPTKRVSSKTPNMSKRHR